MLTYEEIRRSEAVNSLIEAGNAALGVIGFTDHGFGHATVTAKTAGAVLESLGYDPRECELARIAAYMHDIGNAVNRSNHALTGGTLAYTVLSQMQVPHAEIAAIVTAIGNHDEHTANAVTPISAALILADKSDVRRSRVRCKPSDPSFDIHDRVNYAVVDSALTVHAEDGVIALKLSIDTSICPVMDYFEIFLTRMILCRDAASFLKMRFELIINETRML